MELNKHSIADSTAEIYVIGSLAVCGRLTKDNAPAFDQLIALVPPDRALAQITGAPDCKTEKVACGIQPRALERDWIAHDPPAYGPRLNHAVNNCTEQERSTDGPMARHRASKQTEKAIRHCKDKSGP